MTDRSHWQVRKSTLSEQGREDDLADASMEQRIGMVWQLTVDAWAMKGEDVTEQRLLRHVVSVKRRGG
jgi:hypothetical protein